MDRVEESQVSCHVLSATMEFAIKNLILTRMRKRIGRSRGSSSRRRSIWRSMRAAIVRTLPLIKQALE